MMCVIQSLKKMKIFFVNGFLTIEIKLSLNVHNVSHEIPTKYSYMRDTPYRVTIHII